MILQNQLKWMATGSMTLTLWFGMGASSADAAVVTLNANNGVEQDILDIAGFATNGEDMGDAATISATAFGSGLPPVGDTVPWVSSGARTLAGSATGIGWTFNEFDDTFATGDPSGVWTLDLLTASVSIERLVIEGFAQAATGNVQNEGVLFDRTLPSFGTDGSARGRDFLVKTMNGAWDLLVTYEDFLDNTSDGVGAPVGDLYHQLTIEFIDPGAPVGQVVPLPFLEQDEMESYQDTDLELAPAATETAGRKAIR